MSKIIATALISAALVLAPVTVANAAPAKRGPLHTLVCARAAHLHVYVKACH